MIKIRFIGLKAVGNRKQSGSTLLCHSVVLASFETKETDAENGPIPLEGARRIKLIGRKQVAAWPA